MTETFFIAAARFKDRGGWTTDTLSFPATGAAYLLAHGLGVPVGDAWTTFESDAPGEYHLWVRTRDWTAVWGRNESPGRFQVVVNGAPCGIRFGTEGADWHWQYGGTVPVRAGVNEVRLHDLTGFEARCEAVCFTAGPGRPAEDRPGLEVLRRMGTGTVNEGRFDLLVAGGGIAGCCAAVTAARLGLKTALVQDRPVPGGNNSSEVRVGLSGLIAQDPYPGLGLLMDELGGVGHWTAFEARQNPDTERSRRILEELGRHPEKMIHNAGPASNYEDGRKLDLLREAGVSVFLSTRLVGAVNEGGRITGVTCESIQDGTLHLFEADLFADCTGDGDLGYLAGAQWRSGREPACETLEPRAPEAPDGMTMGASVQWYAEESDRVTSFPECPWALQFSDANCIRETRGDWQWEAGIGRDQVYEAEYIRDHALRAVYGNWSFLKNRSSDRQEYSRLTLAWVAAVAGKRESRRLVGDVVLREQDILASVPYDDASFTTTWPVDLHFPVPTEGVGGEPFLAGCDNPPVSPYAVPYRCLYSCNVENLFMAGRDISVTHVALGSVRVMRTCGMMGEVVGMAASLCKEHGTLPRGIYEKHLDALKALMAGGSVKKR